MKIFEVKDRSTTLINKLLEVWEDSVKATHLFYHIYSLLSNFGHFRVYAYIIVYAACTKNITIFYNFC